MGRRLGLMVVVLGTTLTLGALGGILEGSFAQDAGWQRFMAAIGGMLTGLGLITWGGTKYAGVGARI